MFVPEHDHPPVIKRVAMPDVAPPILGRRRAPSLPELAHQAVVEAIVDRHFAPGTRLNIDRLAEQLGMSTTPVREALARAAAQRLVIQDNNRGFTVAPLLEENEYHQLFAVRYLLETHALANATPRQADVARLTDIVDRMSSMGHGPEYRDFGDFNQADREFHHRLIATARNAFLEKAWSDLHFHLHVGRLYAGQGVIDFGYALREHAAIVDALHRGDRDGAIRAASLHIGEAEKRLKKLLVPRTSPSTHRGSDTSEAGREV